MVQVRPTDGSDAEVSLVADRMRATLVEVLGQERGNRMYSPAWLRDRVRFHLDPQRCIGEVFVAEAEGGAIVGHTIVRVETEAGHPLGLFSTTYVTPEARRGDVATALLDRGEAWIRDRGLTEAATYTEPGNRPLIQLFTARGYTSRPVDDDFVRLGRRLDHTGGAGRHTSSS